MEARLTAESIAGIANRKRDKVVPIRGLINTGATQTMLLKQFIRKGDASHEKQECLAREHHLPQMVSTFTNRRKELVECKSPEHANTKAPPSSQGAEERKNRILDVEYSAADVNDCVWSVKKKKN
jgi:hypothetical protein